MVQTSESARNAQFRRQDAARFVGGLDQSLKLQRMLDVDSRLADEVARIQRDKLRAGLSGRTTFVCETSFRSRNGSSDALRVSGGTRHAKGIGTYFQSDELRILPNEMPLLPF